MSKPKRDAQEAFGEDQTQNKQGSQSKRRKERRKQSRAAHPNTTPATQAPVTAETVLSSEKKPGPSSKEPSTAVENTHETSVQKSSTKKTKSRKLGSEDVLSHEELVSAVDKSEVFPKSNTATTSPRLAESKEQESRAGRRKQRRKSRREHVDSVPPQTAAHVKKKDETKQKIKHRETITPKKKDTSKWSISTPAGGSFIDHDPILTLDEQFLILATRKDIQVYATKTSLLVRTIRASTTSTIATLAQLPGSSQHLVVGLKNGTIKKFDWNTGKRIWTKHLDNDIVSITPTSSGKEGDNFLVIIRLEDKQTAITSLTVDTNGEQTGLRPMLSKNTLTGQVAFSAELGIAVVCTQDAVLVGRLSGEGLETTLSWEEISISTKVACFDAQIKPSPAKEGKGKKALQKPVVDIAIGSTTGEIHLYNDVLNKKSASKELTAQRLHWHRAAPRTVKFSPDSNYLISGGDETVLVIWQLDTNQKQVLPHLTSAILNATVSAQGSAYALRLADNSIMVLSTSDLKPFANVSGLSVDASSALFLPDYTIPAVLHPQHTDRLLLAHSSQSLTSGLRPSEKSLNMLQTYDTASQLQLSRQALARNLASVINIGGNGQLIHEPDVTHLDISHDGKWLVTVDQWSPNRTDLNQIYLSRGDNLHRGLHNESFLRFWSAVSASGPDTITGSWDLNTRVDEPVSLDLSLGENPAVLALAISPVRYQVAVADTNHHLKIYTPKARMKGGLPVRDSVGQQLFSWTCDHDLSFQEASVISSPRSSTLAFSEDGSVLAATWASTADARARVHLIELKSGSQVATLPDIVSSGRSCLAFSGQNLLALSSKFCIFDTVTMQNTTIFNIEEDFPNNRFEPSKSRLAVNTRSGTAAVALSERSVEKASHILIFDLNSRSDAPMKAMQKERLPENVHILLPERDRGGFFIVDGEGRSMRLMPPGPAASAVITGAMKIDVELPDKEADKSRLENVFGSGRKVEKDALVEMNGSTNGQAQKSGSSVLEDVFKFMSSREVPSPMELFSRVVGVVGGATRK